MGRLRYRKNHNGDFEFYDRAGYDPQTGEKLSIITREVFAEWQNRPRCYVITREGVRYGDKPGLDLATGRQCRQVTAQILERLREYEKGKRPKKIAAGEPTFFNPATGEANVWYYKNKRGNIEIFDLMGFDPQTGEELLPVTKEVAELWTVQKNSGRIPQRVDPENYQFFDPVTGEARA